MEEMLALKVTGRPGSLFRLRPVDVGRGVRWRRRRGRGGRRWGAGGAAAAGGQGAVARRARRCPLLLLRRLLRSAQAAPALLAAFSEVHLLHAARRRETVAAAVVVALKHKILWQKKKNERLRCYGTVFLSRSMADHWFVSTNIITTPLNCELIANSVWVVTYSLLTHFQLITDSSRTHIYECNWLV